MLMELFYVFMGIVVGYFLSEWLNSKKRVRELEELDIKFKKYADSAEEYQCALIKMYESIMNGHIVEVEPREAESVEQERIKRWRTHWKNNQNPNENITLL